MRKLVLASASPRRARILLEAGYRFEVCPMDVAEIALPGEPAYTVAANALSKLSACRVVRPDAEIIAADTLVWFRGELIGKPRDYDEAAGFLRRFSGASQTVFSAVACSRPSDVAPYLRIASSVVVFRRLDESNIREYIELVRPYDRAGAYDVSDYGDLVVSEVIGSCSNVAGLPLDEVRVWLDAAVC